MDKAARSRAITVAVVDDDVAILDAIRLVLEVQEWRIRTYMTGEEFLADLHSCRPDCVLMDPHLPGLDGVSVIRSMHREGFKPGIVALTAQPDSSLSRAIEKAGARTVHTKPVSAEALLGSVRAAIGTNASG